MVVQKERSAKFANTMTMEEFSNRSFHKAEFSWVEQEFDLLFRVDAANDLADESANATILKNLEAEMHGMMRAMSLAMLARGKQLLRSKETGLTRKSNQKLLPWLPWPGSVIAFHANSFADELEKAFDLAKPIVDQRLEGLSIPVGQITVDQFHFPSPSITTVIPINTFKLISLEFELGSIWSKAKVRRTILAATMAVLGLGFVGTEISGGIDRSRQEQKFIQKVKAAAKGPAVEYCGQRFSYDKLRTLQEDALDYNAKGISAAEKSCRVAEEQVGLNLALNINMPVDGNPGKRTLDAEKQFGVENKVPGRNSNEMFRGKVLLQFRPPSER